MKTETRQPCGEFAVIYARELPGSNKERLERNLEKLEDYFKPGSFISLEDESQLDALLFSTLRDLCPGSGPYPIDKPYYLPKRELLAEIECDVLVLAGQHDRVTDKRFPIWKTFERVDKRVKGLRLKSRVNDLIRHAQRLLSNESVLAKAVTEAKAGSARAQCTLRDMVLDHPQKLGELLLDDRLMVLQRCMSVPLVLWAVGLGHPMAKDLGSLAECFDTPEEIKADERRSKIRWRVRLHRSRKKFPAKKALLLKALSGLSGPK